MVTGSSGIAAASTRKLVADGACVYVVGIDKASCEDLLSELGGTNRMAYQLGDVTVPGLADEVVSGCLDHFGRVDGLFNVAGVSGRKYGDGPLHESTDEGWQATLHANLDSQYLMCKAVVRRLLQNPRNVYGQRGVVLNMSSILGMYVQPKHFSALSYATSKGAIIHMTRTMAAYYAAEGIRINALAPALTETRMSERAVADPQIQDFVKTKQALTGGMLQADDVAEVALFLLGKGSRAITGQTIVVDGGWSVL